MSCSFHATALHLLSQMADRNENSALTHCKHSINSRGFGGITVVIVRLFSAEQTPERACPGQGQVNILAGS